MGARVLIIEDNPANVELMSYLLKAFGHTVLVAFDGHTGLQAAACNDPELIICDMHLPDIDGFEVARRLRIDPALGSIPLVAVTALAMVGDRDRVLAAGFDGYLSKPIDPETFVQQVEAFLLHRRADSIPEKPAAPIAFEPAATSSRHLTILAVDNLPVHLELARSILVPSGYNVITATTMAEGLALARKNGCDLILSDVCMPKGSGFEFLEAVQADPQLRAIPFILLTSTCVTDSDRAAGLAMGAKRYLCRPIEADVILAEIQGCLQEIRAN